MEATTFGSLCTGIGGFDLGFHRHGMKCVYQNEIDPTCRRVLARQFPNVPIGTDVTDDAATTELVRLRPDWLAFGFPCQDLSVAGRRTGLAGKRSGLFFRCCDLVAACNPVGFCIENVPGLLSSGERRDMGIVLRTLGQLGYWWAYRVFDAQWFGVAQRRRRVFIVGHLRKRSAAEILFERESLPWDSAPSRETRTRVAALTARGVGTCGADDNQAQAGHLIGDVFPTIDANMDRKFGSNKWVDSGQFVMAFAQNQRDEVRDLNDCAGALAAEPGMKQQTYVAFSSKDHGADAGELAPTLRSMNFADSHMNGGGQVAVAFNATDYKNGAFEHCDQSGTLTTSADSSRAAPIVKSGYGVRRLTPRECERLQGFPDDWTRYADDGKEISDSARYRMLGNAVCVNVAEFIGRRIVAAANQ
jgi:DNA (cytosine-5)-methyltransferase 1